MSDRLRLPNSHQLYFSGGTAEKNNLIEVLARIIATTVVTVRSRRGHGLRAWGAVPTKCTLPVAWSALHEDCMVALPMMAPEHTISADMLLAFLSSRVM